MKNGMLLVGFLVIAGATCVGAQQPGPPARTLGAQPLGPDGPPPFGPARPPMERALNGPPGRWWKNPDMAQKLGLTAEQQKKMDDIFLDSRLKLIDLNASLQKDEAILEPLVAADQPDERKILSQIDRVAQGRADLEKANARMLLGIRRVLTPEQWKKLSADAPPPPPGPGERPGRRDGPGAQGGPPRGNMPPGPPGD
jgi:protein CpxP